jgi:hypothetical protein
MVLKAEAEIANVVSMALAAYANRVQNGLVSAYVGLLKEDSVDVTLRITADRTVTEVVIVTSAEPEGFVPMSIIPNETVELEEKPKSRRKKVEDSVSSSP